MIRQPKGALDRALEVLDSHDRVSKATRRKPGEPHYDAMYYKGCDDTLRLLREQMRLFLGDDA